jgi:hypothetical protein
MSGSGESYPGWPWTTLTGKGSGKDGRSRDVRRSDGRPASIGSVPSRHPEPQAKDLLVTTFLNSRSSCSLRARRMTT